MRNTDQHDSLKEFFLSPLSAKKACFWLAVIGFAAYFNSFFNGFVWDDVFYVVNNPLVHAFNFPVFFVGNIYNNGGQYRPLTAMLLSLIYTLFGPVPFWYHLIMLIIHIINACFVFWFFSKFFSKGVSFILSAVFLVHPVQVESVTFISSGANLPFFLFGISGLVLGLKKTLSRRRLVAICGLFFLSLLSKEAGISFIISFLGYRLLFHRKSIIADSVPALLSVLLYVPIRLIIGNAESGLTYYSPMHSLSFFQRLLNLPAILAYYLKLLVFPVDLAINQQWTVNALSSRFFFLPLLVVVCMLALMMAIGKGLRHSKLFSVFVFFGIITVAGILPYLQLVPLSMTVADRWLYAVLFGLLGMLGVIITHAGTSRYITVAGIAVIILFMSLTVMRNMDWVSNMSLYSNDIRISDNFLMEGSLANSYYEAGNYEKFLYHTNRSIRMLPNESNIGNLATYYLNQGDYNQAEKYFKKALEYKVYPPTAHDPMVYGINNKLAWSYVISGQYEKALSFVQSIIAQYPGSATLWADVAISDYKLGRKREAVMAVTKARDLDPSEQIFYLYGQITQDKPLDLVNAK